MIKIFSTLFLTSIFFAACCNCSVSNDNIGISKNLLNKADEFVISKTGKDFFDHYINSDPKKITKTNFGYLMVYNFSIPEKEDIKGEIRFSIDTLGNVNKNMEITGIPDCMSDSKNCEFKISKDEATEIAEQNGLEKGIKDWATDFLWNSGLGKYTWQIRTTLTETNVGEFKKGSGKIMFVDPNDGSILKTDEWRVN
ncbi:MAG TPA: PepSY domain-containing protein [Ignavibacteriaceae bacterium]|nr:PepSY domain-containing protein [Ignavibacteriaceae bacterium]